ADGRKTLYALTPALTLGMVVIPLNEILTLAISYPLRLISTFMTAGILNFFTDAVSRDNTILYLGKQPVAITDSCSGVTQLGVLLFFAYLLLRKNNSPWFLKLIWLLLLLPWILIANTIRLLLTTGLYYAWGDKAFSNTPHIILGFLFVITATLLMWFSRKLIDDAKND
ncbi:MAG: archaeosortase/exosortase family protein, partial [Victivallaceae bacterium]